MKFVGKKRASITIKELGSNLRRMFKWKRFDGKLYLFAFITFSKRKADGVAQRVQERGGSARITKEGKMFAVWERYGK